MTNAIAIARPSLRSRTVAVIAVLVLALSAVLFGGAVRANAAVFYYGYMYCGGTSYPTTMSTSTYGVKHQMGYDTSDGNRREKTWNNGATNTFRSMQTGSHNGYWGTIVLDGSYTYQAWICAGSGYY